MKWIEEELSYRILLFVHLLSLIIRSSYYLLIRALMCNLEYYNDRTFFLLISFILQTCLFYFHFCFSSGLHIFSNF